MSPLSRRQAEWLCGFMQRMGRPAAQAAERDETIRSVVSGDEDPHSPYFEEVFPNENGTYDEPYDETY